MPSSKTVKTGDTTLAVDEQVTGWKAGDRASWEEQLRSRAQGQNDYAKTK